MPLRLAYLIVLLAAVAAPALADGDPIPDPSLPPDTVAVVSDATRPVLALDPANGDQHVAFVSNGTLIHSWNSGGGWLSEPVASSVSVIQTSTRYGGFDLQVAPGGQVFAIYRKLDGQLEFAARVGGVWQPEVLDQVPTQVVPVSLAVSPVTGEPTVAWTKAGTPTEIKLARRSVGSWAVQVVDTVSIANSKRTVSVGVDLADRPRVAWGRPRGDSDPRQVLTCATAAAPGGPYIAVAVDSQLVDHIAVAVDPASGEPRIVYEALDSSNLRAVRYAARDGLVGWQVTHVHFDDAGRPPGFTLDPSGDPFIAITTSTPIAPAGVQAGDLADQTTCSYVATSQIDLYHRYGGAGLGSFTWFDHVARPDQSDAINGPRALASRQYGVVDVAWRTPAITCSPYAVSITRRSPLAGVIPGPRAGVALAPIAPNPARLGGPLRVTFRLERAARVMLELRDVAGRHVAERSIGEVGPGPHELDWSPAAPRAGVYWLTVRANGGRLGTRSAVLVR